MGSFTLADGTTGAFHSTMLEDYGFAGEIAGESDVSTVALGSGRGYAPLFIGRSGVAVYVAPESDAPEGWRQELLPSSLSPGQVVGCLDGSATPVVFGIGPNLSSPDVRVTKRASDGTWSEWSEIEPSSPATANLTVAELLVDGSTLYAVLADSGGSASVWLIDWAGAGTWTPIGEALPRLLAPATVNLGGSLVRGLVVAQSREGTSADLVFLPRSAGTPSTLAKGVAVNLLSACVGGSGASLVFVADRGTQSGTPSVSMLDGDSPLAGLTAIGPGVGVSELAAADAGPAPATLFATSSTGPLLIWQEGAGGMFDLGMKLSSIVAATGPDGHGELLGVNVAKIGLERWWQQPTATGSDDDPGAWSSEDIRIPVHRLAGQYAHSTVFTLKDEKGAPLTHTPVEVHADETATLTAGAKTGTVSPRQGLETMTDGAGRVRVTVPSERLNAAKLKVVPAHAAVEAADVPWALANEHIFKRTKTMTLEDVKRLVRDPGDAPGVLKAIQAASAAAYPDNPSPAPTEQQRSWRLTLQAGSPAVWEELSHERARALIAAVPGDPRPLGAWYDWFEDVAEAVVNAAESVYTYVVTPVKEGIEAAIEAIIDGVKYVFKAVLDAVEEGIEFVQTLLAAAWATLERIVRFFGWLLTDARADIWRTKQYLEQLLLSGIENVASLAGRGAAVSGTFFAEAKHTVQQNFAKMIADVGSDTFSSPATLGSRLANGRELGNPLDDALDWIGSAATWLWDKIVSLAAGLAGDFSLPEQLASKVASLLSELTSRVVEPIESSITAFVEHVEGYASSATSFGELALKTVLEAAEDILLAVLGVADALSHAFLETAHAVLEYAAGACRQEVKEPILQALYDLANPGASEPLTAAGLSALVLALPGTVVYYAINDAAPFPADAAQSTQPDERNQLLYLCGIMTIVAWAPLDTALDVPPDSQFPLSKGEQLLWTIAIGNCVPLALYVLTWPGAPNYQAPSFKTPQDSWKWCAVLAGALPLTYNVIVTFLAGGVAGARSERNCPGLACFAAMALAMNVLNRAFNGGDVADWLAAFSGPLPAVTKPLKLTKSPYATVAICIVDVVCDATLGGARIAKAG